MAWGHQFTWDAVAQEVEQVIYSSEGQWFDLPLFVRVRAEVSLNPKLFAMAVPVC